MPELHVRNLPPELHERLREQARLDGRSMSAEAVAILEQALMEGHQPKRRQHAIGRLRAVQRRNRLPDGAPTAEHLVREDRDSTP